MTLVFMVVWFILVPSSAFAWGPLTHCYLANELFYFAPLIPTGIRALLRKYRQDFLYGNLMADMILGKSYLPDEKSSHSWDVALNLLKQAGTGPERAFVYGYLCHLAADTVAHETLIENKLNVRHAIVELRADSLIDKIYWVQSVTISRSVQRRNDRFLENSLDRFIFSFKTNKRIYKGIVLLSLLNKKRRRGVDHGRIQGLHEESIARMIDLLKSGRSAAVIGKSPL